MAIMHMLANPRPRHLLKLGDSSNNPTPLCRPQARGGPSTPPSAHGALSPPRPLPGGAASAGLTRLVWELRKPGYLAMALTIDKGRLPLVSLLGSSWSHFRESRKSAIRDL